MRERKPQKSTQPVPKPLQSDSEFEEENNYIEPTPTPVAVTDLKAKLQNVGAAAKQRVQDKPTPAPRKTKPFNEPNTGFNDSVDIGDDHQLEELDKKNPVGECIKAFNQGNADRNEKFPTAGYMVIGHKMKNGKGGGEIGKMKLIMSRLSLSNGQLPDFFYFVAREWNSIISEDMAWVGADTFKSEANLGFILAHVHVFIGLYNSNFKNPASKDGSRLRPIHAVKLEAKKAENTMRIEVATRGEPLTDAQQELFVEMSLLNISSFEPYCPIVKKLSYEHQRTLRLAYADYNSERFEQGKKTRPLAVYRNRPKTVADEAKAKKADKPNGSYTRRTNKDMLNHKPKGMSIRDFMDQKFKDAGI